MQPADFVLRMMALWSKPRDTADAQIAAEEYCKALARFTAAELDAGWSALRDSHDGKVWPTISVVIRAVSSKRAKPKVEEEPWRFPEFADAVMQGDLGLMAAREGWILGLWDFCYDAGRVPTDLEMAELCRLAAEAEKAASKIDRATSIGRTLGKISDAMKARELKLCKLVWLNRELEVRRPIGK